MKPMDQLVAKSTETLAPTTPATPRIMPTSPNAHPWKFQTLNPQTTALLNAAKWFCADIATKQPPYWLCLVGNSGTGKTHIAKAICAWFKLHAAGEEFMVQENVIGRTDYRYRSWYAI